jgi:hypothetical protein
MEGNKLKKFPFFNKTCKQADKPASLQAGQPVSIFETLA